MTNLCILLSFDFNLSARLRSSRTMFLSSLKTDFMSSTELKTSARSTGKRSRSIRMTGGGAEIIVAP